MHYFIRLMLSLPLLSYVIALNNTYILYWEGNCIDKYKLLHCMRETRRYTCFILYFYVITSQITLLYIIYIENKINMSNK